MYQIGGECWTDFFFPQRKFFRRCIFFSEFSGQKREMARLGISSYGGVTLHNYQVKFFCFFPILATARNMRQVF